jgi:NADH-quinone oxidoreductase subunit H
MNVITVSAVTVTAFLGGPAGPVPDAWEGTIWGALLGFVYFALKVFIFVFVFIWLRGTLPRTRYDRLMVLGWKVLLPFSLAWVMITAAVVLWREAPPSWLAGSSTRYILIGIAAAAGLWLIAPMFSRRPPDDSDDPTADHDSDVDKVSV